MVGRSAIRMGGRGGTVRRGQFVTLGGKWIVIDIWVESAQGSKLDCLQRDYVYYKIAYEIKRRFFLSFFV